MKLNLKKMYAFDDKDGNTRGYGPGVVDVPEEDLPYLERRGVVIEQVKVESSGKDNPNK